MTDIVDRLRARREFLKLNPGRWHMSQHQDQDCADAADEIERLRRVLAYKQAEIDRRRSFIPPDAEVSVVEWPKL